MKKNAQIANFNLVFGDREEPMLSYFDSIVIPALTSGIIKESGEAKYLIKYIKILNNNKNEYVLVGKLIKSTTLEILSDLDEDGELVEKDEKYSSAPYSTFAIYLKNHRMFYVQNQKGSPTLANFRSTVNYALKMFVKKHNKNAEENKKFPNPMLNVVGIPSARNISQILSNVEKVNMLTLRFYPLNGDIDYTELFNGMTVELRNKVGSKRGEVTFKSPQSIDGIVEVIEKSYGTVDPILKVTTKEKSKLTINDYQISEKYEVELADDLSFDEETKQIVMRADKVKTMQYTSDEHNEIYESNKTKIIPFIRR